ncbi:MAG: penicillin acylase family protein [Acidobacteria bacterium]|nr:penicillin acylase family protein [Acidobacteriota bacterium]
MAEQVIAAYNFYVYGNAVPRRSTKFIWTKPVDGSLHDIEWRGFHALEKLLVPLNPKSDFLQNCASTAFVMTSAGNLLKEKFPVYYGTTGNTFVAVTEFGKTLQAQARLVFGQIGDPNSPNHLAQAELYAVGKFKPVRLTLAEIKTGLDRKYRPGKEKWPRHCYAEGYDKI